MLKNQSIPGPNGRPIIFDLYLQDEPSPLLILVHGFKSYKDWGAYNLLAEYFHEQGLNVCKFNFSHNGGTANEVIDFPDLEAFGRNTISKEMADLQSLINHIFAVPEYSKGIDKNKVFLMGHSRGGGIAALTAVEDSRISGYVLLNAVTDLHDYMDRIDTDQWRKDGVLYSTNGRTKQEMPLYLDLLDDFEANWARFDILGRITELNTPCLIVHCIDDAIVPLERSEAFDRLVSNSELLILKEGGHTLGAKQPWDEKTLPLPLQIACEASLAFVRRLT